MSIAPDSQDDAREELQRDIPIVGLLGLALVGWIVIAAAEFLRWGQNASVFGLGLLLSPFPLWFLRKRWLHVGNWALVLTYVGISLLVIAWLRSDVAFVLLALPVILSILLLTPFYGLALSLAATIVLLGARGGLRTSSDFETLIVLAVLWGTTACSWVLVRFAREALQWSWAHYRQMSQLLGEARDQRVELKQTRDDLQHANLELARLSERLEVMRRMAVQARQAKEEFAANVSHELRTPLNMIIGFSEMLTQAPEAYGAPLPSALLADVAVIQRNSRHLASLVNDVLDLSQVQVGRMAISKEWCSLGGIIEAAVQAVVPLFDSKGLYLRADVPPDLPLLLCDRTRIRQVILNLLSNAGRFVEQGGAVVRVRLEQHDVLVSVTDSGPGIPPEDRDRIFEPFRQAGDSILRRHDGSGLGLSISKQFVEMHGGRMWLESEVGRGSAFWFTLPLEEALPLPQPESVGRWFSPYHTYEARERPSKALQPEVKPRFVILEAGHALQKLLGRYEDRAEITVVHDRQEAVAELARLPAQALIVNDPSLEHGLCASRWVTDLPFGTPAIVCSVPAEEEMAERLGVARYLVKPVARETLLATLTGLARPINSILLVDDEPEILQLFARMLSSAGSKYRILRALDGLSALALARERQPDVMLLDLILPGMDGYAVLQEKARDTQIRDIPVIAITAQDPVQGPAGSGLVTIARGGGLSLSDLLTCIREVSAILMSGATTDGPERSENSPG